MKKIDIETKKSEYLKLFGKNSLDNVLCPDFVHDSSKGFEDFYIELDNAIKTNKPLESININLLNKIIR